MGLGVKCYIGFSIAFANEFSERLERYGGALQRHQRGAAYDFDLGLEALHNGVDAALAGDGVGCSVAVDRGLAELASCNDHLTAAAETLVQARADLFERAEVDPNDNLLAREAFFASVDYEAVHRELAAHGAALPGRACWDELAGRLRDGGARAGLRLLDRHYRELQSDVRAFANQVEVARRLPGRRFAESLHGATRDVTAVSLGFARLSATCAYLSILCERASELQARSTAPLAAVS